MRKVSKKKAAHRASKAGKDGLDYMLAVKQLPCCICGAPPPSEAHHTICSRFGSRKTSDFNTIPLCAYHHRVGPDAIHNGKESWVEKYGPDTDYIERTRKLVEEHYDRFI